ncbi:hypothetical protein BOTBODRAFT_118313 [Botryobasidium botryosum FD-172 SS1]|uniref:DUF659 domain-containing protein n=1 Tax=Botryobasidium botryosum (strain FD-172 SS1) TaxID=930990 RepID=A0A067M9P2_BOTB1|nr:hypothetical protein BOTBODRAFT_118313 [Botryobasidium botryosum FD-172 SS1]
MLLCAFVSAGWAWQGAQNPEVVAPLRRYIPGASIPTRFRLLGTILDKEVKRVEDAITKRMKGSYTTTQSDGWKNIQHTHLLVFMVTGNSKVRVTHLANVSAQRKNALGLYELMKDELECNASELGLINIGFVSDTSGKCRSTRLMLHAEFPQYLVANCYAHQIQLVVGDYMKRNPAIRSYIEQAVEIVKWFNTHSYALRMFMEEQKTLTKHPLKLITPFIIRWTTHCLAITRLLHLHTPLQTLAMKHHDELVDSVGMKTKSVSKAKRIMNYISDQSLWEHLREIKSHLQPLAVAAHVTQAADTRADHVLLMFGKLFKRWAKADQDIFIAAVYLNPFVKSTLFSHSMSPIIIHSIVWTLYTRVFQKNKNEIPPKLGKRLMQYHNRTGPFSSVYWGPEQLKEMYGQVKRFYRSVAVWNLQDTQQPLARVAILILSFICNSAGCERLFSVMGDIQTKKQNRLNPEKTCKTATVKLDILREHAISGHAPARKKRRIVRLELAGPWKALGNLICWIS